MQSYLVEVIPGPPGGLNEDARSLVELVDLSFDIRGFSKQRLFIHDAGIRVDHIDALLGQGGRYAQDDERADRKWPMRDRARADKAIIARAVVSKLRQEKEFMASSPMFWRKRSGVAYLLIR